jgi:hypothetical protein
LYGNQLSSFNVNDLLLTYDNLGCSRNVVITGQTYSSPYTNLYVSGATATVTPFTSSTPLLRNFTTSSNGCYQGFIGGGLGNTVSGRTSSIVGGAVNTITSDLSFIGGGLRNSIIPNYVSCLSVIGGGFNNTITSFKNFIGGGQCNTISGGTYSVISGGRTNCVFSSWTTIGGGESNISCGTSSTIGGGNENCTNANFSTIGGGRCNILQSPINGSCSLGATIGGGAGNNTSGGTFSSTGVFNVAPTKNNAGKLSTIGGGFQNNAQGLLSTIGGGSGNTASGTYSVVGGGECNIASGLTSTIGGGCGNIAQSVWTTIGGGRKNTVSGPRATIAGGFSNLASQSYSSVGGGRENTASGVNSTVGGGNLNTASGASSTVTGGFLNRAYGENSSIIGGNRACAPRFGQRSFASGTWTPFTGTGETQQIDLLGRNTTTGVTTVNIFLDGSSQRISVLNETAMFVTINIAGITSGGTSAAHYIRKVAIKNVGGTTSLIGASPVSTIGTDVEDNALYDVTISADDTNDALDIQVTGAVGDTMRWTVHISGVEIKYSWT